MQNVEEKRLVNGQDITLFKLMDNGRSKSIQIIKSFNNKSELLTFSMLDNFNFEAYIINSKRMEELKKIEFFIDKNDSLYPNFKRLVGKENEIVVEDEVSEQPAAKTMKICKNDDGINIVFENKENSNEVIEKFNVFKKNIVEDENGMIVKDDIREKFIRFFNGVRRDFFRKNSIKGVIEAQNDLER